MWRGSNHIAVRDFGKYLPDQSLEILFIEDHHFTWVVTSLSRERQADRVPTLCLEIPWSSLPETLPCPRAFLEGQLPGVSLQLMLVGMPEASKEDRESRHKNNQKHQETTKSHHQLFPKPHEKTAHFSKTREKSTR